VDAAAPTDAGAPAPERAPTILLIGDSHTYGAFGQRLHELLAGIGRYAVVSEAAGGATTETYLQERPEAVVGYRVRESAAGEGGPRETVSRVRSPMHPLDGLLAAHDPEVVVVALGTNHPRVPVTQSCEAFMQHLMRDRPKRRVFWIGPPAVGADRSAARVTSIRAALEKFPGAMFIDSTTFNAKAPLPADNPHFGLDDARRWAETTFAKMGLAAQL
jgi:hypothetical protein